MPILNKISRKKISESVKKLWKTKKYRAQVTAGVNQLWTDKAYRARHKAGIAKANLRPTVIAVRSKNAQANWKNLEFRKKNNAARIVTFNSSEMKQRVSDWSKKAWENPSYRKRAAAVTKVLWQDPKWRAKQLKIAASTAHRLKISATHKANAHGLYRESTLEYIVVNWARRRNVQVFKLDAQHGAGAPDRIFLIPGGKPFFIEFKRPDGKGHLGKIQQHVIKKMQKAGYDVGVYNDKAEAITAIRERIAMAAAQIPRKGNKVSH